MNEQLRIAIIGAGAMGRDHVRYVQDDPQTVLVALADPMPETEAYAASLGVPWYADHVEMLDAVRPDGVIIASPNRLHLPMARDVIARGIPVLVEKPISDDLDDARAFAAEAREQGAKVLIGQHRRHNPKVRRAKEIIDSGVLGRIVTVSMHYAIYKPDTYYDIPWRRQKGAGPILVNMVHDVDLMRYLIGEPEQIQGMAANAARGFEVEDSAVVNVRFAGGALGSLTLSDAAASPWNWEATARENPFFAPFDTDAYLIMGTRGSLSLPRLQLFTYADGVSDWTAPLTCEIQGVREGLPHRLQLVHFAGVIRGEEQPIVTPEDAIRTLDVLNAVKAAAENGESITLS
ncbi:Gfo/Idh/MocA family protein [Microbacterium dextranolyticum]|uniref:Oxidoreductase n=1 Tax=Microbacterium dextranolyticum TaxID=36806 RepID=A0A9W6HNU3_9MICO|nr:Gfo/Idh/MocA family oxidoreductase [Microbacterium dextranolyticum]MBM7464064.1 putative dehydrogenase [Microbacterium dextranolyticum]GLJ96607.1 oxidoreductase [Microbacterium dextranolyticum]